MGEKAKEILDCLKTAQALAHQKLSLVTQVYMKGQDWGTVSIRLTGQGGLWDQVSPGEKSTVEWGKVVWVSEDMLTADGIF